MRTLVDRLESRYLLATIYGGNGSDTVLIGRDVDLTDPAVVINYSVVTVYGGGGNDLIQVFSSSAGDHQFFGQGGSDTIIGGAGNEYISGGTGNDLVYGNGGNDTLVAGSRGTYYGGTGDDVFYFDTNKSTAVLDGGDGYDVLHITANTSYKAENIFNIEEIIVDP